VTEHGHDDPDRAVEASLDAWAAAAEVPTGWVQDDPGAGRVVAIDVKRAVEPGPAAATVAGAEPPPARARSEPETVPSHVVTGEALDQPAGGEMPEPRRVALPGKLAAHGPEILIGGAFVGGLLVAAILRRLAR
jgi:hypothetical protein